MIVILLVFVVILIIALIATIFCYERKLSKFKSNELYLDSYLGNSNVVPKKEDNINLGSSNVVPKNVAMEMNKL